MALIRKDDEAMKRIFKMIGDFMEHQEDYIKSMMKMEELAAYDDKNPLVSPLEDENISLKKRLMINEKQKNTHENRISEIDLFISERSRDRELERQQKQKMMDKTYEIKNEINLIDKDIDELVKVELSQHKSYKIKTLNTNIDEKRRLLTFFNDRLKKLEQECSNLIQDKKELSSNLEYERQLKSEKKQKTEELAAKLLQYKAALDGTRRYKELVEKEVLLGLFR